MLRRPAQGRKGDFPQEAWLAFGGAEIELILEFDRRIRLLLSDESTAP
jgi:hypothetical protein